MSKFLQTLLIGLWCTQLTQAQTQVADTLELEAITVTASKIPISLRQTTKPVIIIDKLIISRSVGKSLSQILDEQTGIVVNGANSNPGLNKSLYVQGAASKYTLFLIDGLAVQDPNGLGGASDLRNFSLDNIERIEIVKGSMSTLYGSDAIAGVVNIITKKPQSETAKVLGNASYGAYNTYNTGVGMNGSMIGGSYSINFNREVSDGTSEAKDSTNTGNFDDDGFERNSLNVETTVHPIKGLSITPILNYSGFDGNYDDGSFTDASNTYKSHLLNSGIRINYENGAFAVHAGYNFTGIDYSFTSAFGTNEYDGDLQNFDAFSSYSFTSNIKLLAGFNYQHLKIGGEQNTVKNPNSDIYSPYFTTILTDVNGFSAEAGIRFNNHSEFGNTTTYSISSSYSVLDLAKVVASYGTGFRAPSLLELFGPFGANPNLDPETSSYFNIGAESYLLNNQLKIGINYFNRSIEDVIVYTTTFVNQDKQNDSGIEATIDFIINPKITVRGNYNYLTGETSSIDFDGNPTRTEFLIRRPEHSFGLGIVTNPIPELTISLNASHLGERKDLFFDATTFTTSQVYLDAYLLLNLYAEYQLLNKLFTIFVDGRNLTDTVYTEVYGYSTLGFNSKLGFRFNF